MNTADIILLILWFGFTWAGFWYGLIQTLGGIIGIFAGAVIAGRFYTFAGSWIGSADRLGLSQWLAFTFIFVVVNRVVAIAIGTIGKVLNVAKIIPGVGLLNRLGGAIVGLVEGALVLGLIITVARTLLPASGLVQQLDGSRIADLLGSIGGTLTPLLPEAIRGVKTIINV